MPHESFKSRKASRRVEATVRWWAPRGARRGHVAPGRSGPGPRIATRGDAHGRRSGLFAARGCARSRRSGPAASRRRARAHPGPCGDVAAGGRDLGHPRRCADLGRADPLHRARRPEARVPRCARRLHPDRRGRHPGLGQAAGQVPGENVLPTLSGEDVGPNGIDTAGACGLAAPSVGGGADRAAEAGGQPRRSRARRICFSVSSRAKNPTPMARTRAPSANDTAWAPNTACSGGR